MGLLSESPRSGVPSEVPIDDTVVYISSVLGYVCRSGVLEDRSWLVNLPAAALAVKSFPTLYLSGMLPERSGL